VLDVLPFVERGEWNRVYVDLAPEGNRPFVWLLDTGAQASVMTPLAARAAHVSVRRVKNSPYVRKTRLGRNVRFWVDTSTSDTGSPTGWEYGLLGGEFLAEYVVEIDFPRRVVRFIDPEKYEVPKEVDAPGEQVLPMRVIVNRPFIEFEINGETSRSLLDTGTPMDLIISGRAARNAGIDWEQLPRAGRVQTTRGPMEVRLYEASDFRFGGFEFGRMPVLVAPRGWYNIGGNTDSALGFDVLRQFVVRLDYRRGRLWLKRSGDPTVTYLGVDYERTRRCGALLRAPAGGTWSSAFFPTLPRSASGCARATCPCTPSVGDHSTSSPSSTR
jgi:predicted aspartyl protease